MASITLEVVVYDGKSVKPAELNNVDPQTDLGKRLYALGFKQKVVYDPLYDRKFVMTHPTMSRIEKGQGALVHNGEVIAIIDAADVDKPKPAAKPTVKKSAPPAVKKAAVKKAVKKAK